MELIRLWRRRSTPVIRRMVMRGRGPSSDGIAATLTLLAKSEVEPEAFADPQHAHRSHHLAWCPASIRNRGRSPADETAVCVTYLRSHESGSLWSL
jgi:hypothetical protein